MRHNAVVYVHGEIVGRIAASALCNEDEIPGTVVRSSGFGSRCQGKADTANDIRDSRLFMIFSPEDWLMFGKAPVVGVGHCCLLLVYRSCSSTIFFHRAFRELVCNSAAPYAAVQPPSMARLAPVICAAASLHRNSASEATCSTVTNSLVGWAASRTSLIT